MGIRLLLDFLKSDSTALVHTILHDILGFDTIITRYLRSPLSDIVFFDTHDILTIFQFDAIYRDILTIFAKCKLGLNAPKFHSRSACVEVFATKMPIYGIC